MTDSMPYSYPQLLDKATIYREWKHILLGAMALAGTAGYINSIVLGFFATPVSHMSGAVSHLGLDIAQGKGHEAYTSVLIIVGFLFGSTLAGMFVGATKLGPSRRYGAVLMFEAVLLLGSTLLLLRHSLLGTILAATACGLQNAMSSSYCGLMIRTTHVSGIMTDLGVMLGHWLRHRRIVTWKLKFLLGLLFSFGAGGITGAWLNMHYGPICLLLASIGCFGAGAIFLRAHTATKRRGNRRRDCTSDKHFP
ncbi:MAG: DUF1275 domain-containing protein [Proteobacteria bacterium]|nr:MAG: DUF1275 domain-containing protein [Pseudomonadota bacterium]